MGTCRGPNPTLPPIECDDTDCQQIINQINYQTQIVKDRYYLMLKDEHSLFTRHNSKARRHDDHGSWVGHREKYEKEQQMLRGLIVEAILKNCEKYIPASAKKWAYQSAPNRPNPSLAQENGY